MKAQYNMSADRVSLSLCGIPPIVCITHFPTPILLIWWQRRRRRSHFNWITEHRGDFSVVDRKDFSYSAPCSRTNRRIMISMWTKAMLIQTRKEAGVWKSK